MSNSEFLIFPWSLYLCVVQYQPIPTPEFQFLSPNAAVSSLLSPTFQHQISTDPGGSTPNMTFPKLYDDSALWHVLREQPPDAPPASPEPLANLLSS